MDGTRQKFILEFDEPPALVFVQHAVGHRCDVYQDGKKLKGVRAITIRAEANSPTTHVIEFATGLTN
jgi:hypothetical protein